MWKENLLKQAEHFQQRQGLQQAEQDYYAMNPDLSKITGHKPWESVGGASDLLPDSMKAQAPDFQKQLHGNPVAGGIASVGGSHQRMTPFETAHHWANTEGWQTGAPPGVLGKMLAKGADISQVSPDTLANLSEEDAAGFRDWYETERQAQDRIGAGGAVGAALKFGPTAVSLALPGAGALSPGALFSGGASFVGGGGLINTALGAAGGAAGNANTDTPTGLINKYAPDWREKLLASGVNR